ncbi:tetratricopeptide repeat protein [Actinobacillus porcinus]|uniref:Beta-lactamase hcpC n=1 Tax=Actinobacillus porcinus TaxID=51048 RepID=A0ABY6TLC1_9PAST|nr:tetratricopeptide repeat protein [Actinobacillus porcinus]VFY93256.1 Putative beta-lactamase hcpC precursor [Actinobacillus porcinus]VTU08100.1 Putative beta-lactamase hcpC precursor [Actinobacillus porcinus]
MTLRKTLLSALLLSFAIAGNVSAETAKEKFSRAVQYDEQQNYQAAFPIFKELAEQGYAVAQFNLGVMYENEQGVNQNYHQAARWYQKAAEQGNAKAQAVLGLMYILGQGVRQNDASAKMWIGKACDNGEQKACDFYHKLNEGK